MAPRFLPAADAGSLPIFRQDFVQYSAFYSPGFLCVVPFSDSARFEEELRLSNTLAQGPSGPDSDCVQLLRFHAERAVEEADRQRREAFLPECLTLYLSNQCNLRCAYCYSGSSPKSAGRLSLKTISAAAELVAKNCRHKDIPLYAVFQGGGEPTLDATLLQSALTLVDSVASDYDVQTYRYLATNGVMSEKMAVWLARSFDLVGLSCDGPPDIHDAQRPNWEGQGSLPSLERTAYVLQEEGLPFHVRVTITRQSLQRQAEIAEYLCQRLRPAEIHVEPLYLGGRADIGMAIGAGRAGEFVDHYLEARRVADKYGVKVSTSGSRIGEIHGPFCNVFRQVLQLVPAASASEVAQVAGEGESAGLGSDPSTDLRTYSGDMATACFKSFDAASTQAQGTTVGRLRPRRGSFEIDTAQVQALRERLEFAPEECQGCFNRFHCTGDCPDRCLLVAGDGAMWGTGFRCMMQKALTAKRLQQKADRLWSEMVASQTEGPHGIALD